MKGAAAKGPNGAGQSFCSQYTPLMAKFPFSPNAVTEASPAEVGALLQPGTGALSQMMNGPLKPLVVQQGAIYMAAPGAPMKVNPDFLRFINHAATLSAALYPPSGSGGLNFNVHILRSPGIQSVAFVVDSQRLAGSDVTKQFTWSLGTAQQAQLVANYSLGSLPLLQFQGPWALFHLVYKGRVAQASPLRLDVPLEASNTQIVVDKVPLVVHYELSGPSAGLLAPGALADTRCVGNVVH
jgi:type VI protein secretion system component VasK